MKNVTTAETATRHVGNCQFCELDHKVQGDRLVHHGYKRPGHGYIYGDCDGVGQLPYELSRDLVVARLAATRRGLADTHDYLGRLRAGRVTVIVNDVTVWNRETRRYDLVPETSVAGVTDPVRWADKVGYRIQDTLSEIRVLERLVTHLEARVADWTLLPLRTVEEEVRKAEGVRAARQAVLDAKRAARQAVLDAKAAKKADQRARHDADVTDLANKVLSADDAGVRDVVYKLRHGTKYGWFRNDRTGPDYSNAYETLFFDLCGDRLRSLGLIYTAPHNGNVYFKF